jgi:DNA polymerase
VDKNQKLELIFAAIRKAYPGKTLVFNDGSPDAPIMIIGEAPGPDEEKLGKPFVGRAGKLLNATLEMLGWQRSDFYITNIVKYRPRDASGNTLTPTPAEIEKFRPATEKEIEVVDPKLIVVLGRIAMSGLGIEGTMAENRGKVLEKNGRKILITYHPAAILRNINWEPMFRGDLSKIAELAK